MADPGMDKAETWFRKPIKVFVRTRAPKTAWRRLGGYRTRKCKDILAAMKTLGVMNVLVDTSSGGALSSSQ